MFWLQGFEVHFIPEIVTVGTDPNTGFLSHNFILYFGFSNMSTEAAAVSEINNILGTVGDVNIEDPIHTLKVGVAVSSN